jgi:hypothetical protein
LQKIADKAADKAGGADGITFAMVKALPSQAFDALAEVFDCVEANLVIPEQWACTQLSLLPKNELCERPIALTSVGYRLWACARQEAVKKWVAEAQALSPWDKAVPGGRCLDVAMKRLIHGEISAKTDRHMISVLVDLKNFYDHVDFHLLEKRAAQLNFPPAVTHVVLQVYAGRRLLVAEDMLSEPIWPARGMLAGCPFAPTLAKVYLWPVMEDVTRDACPSNLDTWVDDISMDWWGRNADQVASHAVAGYRALHSGLQESGLTVSASKTGFLCASKLAQDRLSERRGPSDPQIHSVMKDLGVDNAVGRFRRVKHHLVRMGKGRRRGKHLHRLKVPLAAQRVRLFRGSAVAAAVWGHQASGLPPRRLRDLRWGLARQAGCHRGGHVDVFLSLFAPDVKDLGIVLRVQQVEAWLSILKDWPESTLHELARAWALSAEHMAKVRSPWCHVRGPVGATQAVLMEQGWKFDSLDAWVDATGAAWNPGKDVHTPGILRAFAESLDKARLRRIASRVGCSAAEGGLDWTVRRQFVRDLKKHGKRFRLNAFHAVVQGTLRHSANTGIRNCPLCGVRATMKHVLWQCRWHANQIPVPDEWSECMKVDEQNCLWERGLIPTVWSPVAHTSEFVQRSGVWQDAVTVSADGLVFSTDASGGPAAKDKRFRRVAFAVYAFRRDANGLTKVGVIKGSVPGVQTVFRGELYALVILLEAVTGDCDVTVDCQALLSKLARRPKNAEHQDLWNRTWNADPRRARVVWVNSHLQLQAFMAKFGEAEAWRWHANREADQECGAVAADMVNPQAIKDAATRDGRFRKILEALTDRAQAILGADDTNPSPMAPARASLENRQAKTRAKASNLCFGYTLSMPDWFDALVTGPNPQGHTWRRVEKGLKCSTCEDMLSQVRARHKLELIAAAPCKHADPRELFPQVHVTHQLMRIPHKWKCQHCCAMLRAAKPVISRVMREACGFTAVRKGAKTALVKPPQNMASSIKAFFKVKAEGEDAGLDR